MEDGELDRFFEKFPLDGDWKTMNPPTINEEFADISGVDREVDEGFRKLQKQLATVLRVLSEPLSATLGYSSANLSSQITPQIVEATKNICDVIHSLSVYRQGLIEPQLHEGILVRILPEKGSAVGETLFRLARNVAEQHEGKEAPSVDTPKTPENHSETTEGNVINYDDYTSINETKS
ncbi:uncharacterized protein LOC109606644 [Aethina tumida]|uniref:uncharacterized protein LOC109606644 n=1 Tax=Aethina tumida TaxID=116153 RepID=UPI00096ADD3F|nr:uncharacterized protein LOC109606644 [Aethina tumida]